MTHPADAPEPFNFLGQGTTYLGEKDGQRYYHVPVERVLNHMSKWIKGIRIAANNEQAAEKPRIVVANAGALKQ